MNKINYVYPEVSFRNNRTNNTEVRRLAVAYRLDEATLSFGIAICSSRDQFKKKLAREISTGRLNKRPAVVNFTVNTDHTLRLTEQVLNTVLSNFTLANSHKELIPISIN